ncbi:hypothetical protein FOA52_004133 [Chlamydomonas sp. UWO 241]|nr:hypothetical protein FOA52_004133 [Chlamydomonas sp. UWO 241]
MAGFLVPTQLPQMPDLSKLSKLSKLPQMPQMPDLSKMLPPPPPSVSAAPVNLWKEVQDALDKAMRDMAWRREGEGSTGASGGNGGSGNQLNDCDWRLSDDDEDDYSENYDMCAAGEEEDVEVEEDVSSTSQPSRFAYI